MTSLVYNTNLSIIKQLMYFSRKNVIVRLQGGLGNQLFQYATGKSLALRLGVNLVLDLNWYIDNSDSNRRFILDKLNIDDSTCTFGVKLPGLIRLILYKIYETLSRLGLVLPVLKEFVL